MQETYTRQFHLPSLGPVRINFRAPATTVLKIFHQLGEEVRLSHMRHLGLISTLYTGTQHTRWEYAALQCALVDTIERLHKGTPQSTLGHTTINGQEYPASEILKSWALLANFGHCRNTFADEKALLNFLRRQHSEKRTYISAIGSPSLRRYAENVVAEYRYTDFHYSVASWRLTNDLPKYSRLRGPAQQILSLLLTDTHGLSVNHEKILQLRNIYSVVRKLAIVSLDSQNSHLPIRFDLASAILGFDQTERRFAGQTIENLLDPLIALLTEELYTDRSVLANICSYESQASPTLDQIDLTNGIRKALDHGLISDFCPHLRHFHRQVFPIHRTTNIYDDRRLASRLLEGISGVEAIVDENPHSQRRIIDLCVEDRLLENGGMGQLVFIAVRNIFNLLHLSGRNRAEGEVAASNWWKAELLRHGLSEEFVGELEANYMTHLVAEKDVFGMIRTMVRPVVWSILETIFDHSLDPMTRGEVDESGHYGIWMKFADGSVWEDYYSQINHEISIAPTDSRANELLLIRDQGVRSDALFQFCCLPRVPIYDFSQPPSKRERTDVDGLSVSITKNKVFVALFEGKSAGGRRSGTPGSAAHTDLKRKVLPLLNKTVAPYYRIPKCSRGAKLILTFEHEMGAINEGMV